MQFSKEIRYAVVEDIAFYSLGHIEGEQAYNTFLYGSPELIDRMTARQADTVNRIEGGPNAQEHMEHYHNGFMQGAQIAEIRSRY